MGQVIGFLPASGGVGASTLAAAVAVRAAAADHAVVAVDLDPWSGGLDVRLGLEQEPGWRWDALVAVDGLVDGAGLLERLPVAQGVAVLSSPRSVDAVRSGAGPDRVPPWQDAVPDVVSGLRAACDDVVVDLARAPQLLWSVRGRLDVLVLVAGAGVTQLAALVPLVELARSVVDEPWVVLRGPGDDALSDLLMDRLDVPVVGALRDDRRTFRDLVRGVPPGARGKGPFVQLADTLLLRAAGVAADNARDLARGGTPVLERSA